MSATTKIILDLDTGIDDAMCLTYVLGSPEVELIGVTGVFGNVQVEQGVRNARAILALYGQNHIPVIAGAAGPEQGSGTYEVEEIVEFIHGHNGIGNIELPDATNPATTDAQDAADFLIQSFHRYGQDLIIVPTGPETNIAEAMRRDEDFARGARIVLMGGAVTVPGNVRPWSEANIFGDPDAANYLLRTAPQITMVGLDATQQVRLTKEDTATWRGNPKGDFLADAVDYYIDAHDRTAPGLQGCYLHDPLATAIAIDPSLGHYVPLNLKVDTEGETRGRTIADETRLSGTPKTCQVTVGVDKERFMAELMSRILRVVGS